MHLFTRWRSSYLGAFKKLLLIMKLTSIIILAACLSASASGTAQTVTLNEKNATLERVFKEINRQTGFDFLYNSKTLERSKRVSINVKDAPLEEVLKMCLKSWPLTFIIQDNTIVIKEKTITANDISNIANIPPPIDVQGRIVTENGDPVEGASIQLKGSTKGTTTNSEGYFQLKGVDANVMLIISGVNINTQEIKLNGRTDIIIKATSKITSAEEVIINKGYYTESRKLSTGSVSKVDGETIGQQPVTNVMGALIARVPGLEITQAGGIPGAGYKVRIRGQNSIAAGNNPLFIVDGVPFSSESLGSNQVGRQLPFIDGNIAVSPFNILNPDDIASIEVLKDADATAIYGSRGSNGVVLITTKKGKAGETKYELTMNAAFSKVARFVDMVGTEENLAIRKKAFANDGVTTYPATEYDLNGTWDQSKNTNWQKELIGGTAKNWNIQAGVSGGSENTQFLVRGGVQKETTVFPGDFHYDRGSVLVNLNHKSSDDRFKLNLSANFSTDNNNMLNSDPTSNALFLSPVAPDLYNPDGSLNWANKTWTNPLAALNGTYDGKNRNLNTNMVMDIKLVHNLYLKTSLGFSDYRLDEYLATPSTTINPAFNAGSDRSYAYSNIGNRQNWIVEPQLNWKKYIGKSIFQALAGATFQNQSSVRTGISANNFPSNSLIYNIASASTQRTFINDNMLYKYQAFFGRLNYNLSDKYLLNLTARRDGSSRFSPENQFANFGAVGAAWIFSNERFIQDKFSFLSFGKLRGSYGITGNDQIGDYQFLNTYTTSGSVNYQGVVGLLPQRLYNPNFGWESNKKLEAALELGFFNDRLNLTTSWYRNRSSNQLVGIPLSGITGFTSIQANLPATVENTGWEFELQATIINSKKFSWRSAANLSIPRNKLVSFPGLESSSYASKYVVGQPLTIVKQYHMLGIDPQTGIYQYEDVNKDGQLSAANDRTAVRNIASDYFGGINNSFSLGKLQLDIFVQFTKTSGYNYLYWIGIPGGFPGSVMKDVAKNIWEPGRTDATIQVTTAGANQQALNAWNLLYRSDAAISNYYYARLKNVAFSWQLPELKHLRGRIFIQGQNLFTVTNYIGADPEAGSMQNLGPLRTINCGLQVNF
jgi:TonB-dependent starch-binding outer membrane protein SusC